MGKIADRHGIDLEELCYTVASEHELTAQNASSSRGDGVLRFDEEHIYGIAAWLQKVARTSNMNSLKALAKELLAEMDKIGFRYWEEESIYHLVWPDGHACLTFQDKDWDLDDVNDEVEELKNTGFWRLRPSLQVVGDTVEALGHVVTFMSRWNEKTQGVIDTGVLDSFHAFVMHIKTDMK